MYQYVARLLRRYAIEVAVTIGSAAAVVAIGTLLRGYEQPASIHGSQWFFAPLARFTNDDIRLGAATACLGVACGLVVAWTRAQLRLQAVRARTKR